MWTLDGRTVLLTGASRGIGPILAETLAAEGVQLIISSRTAAPLEQLAQRLRSKGVEVKVIPANLEFPEECKKLVRQALEAEEAIDVLVNNAGMTSLLPYHRIPSDDIMREIALNLAAPMFLSRLVLPQMLKHKRGHIVNIASIAGEVPLPYEISYCATKAGLISFTRSFRSEYKGSGVSASAILPGYIRDVGMVFDFSEKVGRPLPKSLGGCLSGEVAAAVVRAIRYDVPEIIVNHPPIRPFIAFLRLFPRLGEKLLCRSIFHRLNREAAHINLEAGGRYTGGSVAPENQ
jgi:short-subunit dehydrogenase